MMNLQISKAENGFIITVDGDIGWRKQSARFVFNTWEAAAVFLSSLDEHLK